MARNDQADFTAGYARKSSLYGSLEQLEALSGAFVLVNRYLLWCLTISAGIFWVFVENPNLWKICAFAGPVVMARLCIRMVQAVGAACDWPVAKTNVVTALSILNVPVFFGLGCYFALKAVVEKELAKYGVSATFPGVNEKKIASAIESRVEDDARMMNVRWAA